MAANKMPEQERKVEPPATGWQQTPVDDRRRDTGESPLTEPSQLF